MIFERESRLVAKQPIISGDLLKGLSFEFPKTFKEGRFGWKQIMRFQSLVFLGAAAARGIFENIYSLGDSISDNGNYYTISGGTTPGPEYFKGRFSNGFTWVEYLARTLEAKLRVLAFGKATSDSKQFAVDDQLDVPGCIQQADTLIYEYNQKETTTPSLKDHTLVTLAFLGNDFFDPKASAAAVSKNLEKCASTILSHTTIKHILIPTSSAPELFPYFQQDPSQLPLLKQSAAELETSWKNTLLRLKSAHPKVTFYNLNFRGNVLSNSTNSFQMSCTA
ncbi:hypothetical protein DSO57_1031574 [Entomophthora muscae]|uniref:Uncharacterized protein n=1 Tax=Entomophthora muscae TaxID=34485 RepID=A0ACC2RFD6_9FUNG|nr:hypothetical protein DSO57_1031574 [Entomophthora muscae]